MKNWDNPDVQWNLSLGNTSMLEEYAQKKLIEEIVPKQPPKQQPKPMGLIEMSQAIDVSSKKPEMSKDELRAYHNQKGGVVLEEDEFTRYKFYLELLAAE
jgi:hypothetical protein